MIICWTVENNKFYFGKVTRRSWYRAIRGKNGNMLEVKPLKKYERFNYYPDRVFVGLERANLINSYCRTINSTLHYHLLKKGYRLNVDTLELITGAE